MASWWFESTDKNRLQVIWSGAFKPFPYSLTTKQAIGGTDCSKEASFDFLTIITEYNWHGLLHAILIWTPSPLKRLEVRLTAARKPHLGSLTIKEATGDMGCMQASFRLSIKTGYRWHTLQHPSLIWAPSQLKRLQVTWAACKPRFEFQLKQAIGDIDCSTQASSGLPHN